MLGEPFPQCQYFLEGQVSWILDSFSCPLCPLCQMFVQTRHSQAPNSLSTPQSSSCQAAWERLSLGPEIACYLAEPAL